MIAHVISINIVFQEQLPARFEPSRLTCFFHFLGYTFGQSVTLEINNPCTSMGQTTTNGMMLPEWRSVGWATGTLRTRGQAFIAVFK